MENEEPLLLIKCSHGNPLLSCDFSSVVLLLKSCVPLATVSQPIIETKLFVFTLLCLAERMLQGCLTEGNLLMTCCMA